MSLKAHTGFAVPETKELDARIVRHFAGLGYRLSCEQPNEWIFQRGNKSAALWRFNIRAYWTTLKVRADAQRDGQWWISCDWEVYTFMSITTGGDVGTLEAEGHSLESALRRATNHPHSLAGQP